MEPCPHFMRSPHVFIQLDPPRSENPFERDGNFRLTQRDFPCLFSRFNLLLKSFLHRSVTSALKGDAPQSFFRVRFFQKRSSQSIALNICACLNFTSSVSILNSVPYIFQSVYLFLIKPAREAESARAFTVQ